MPVDPRLISELLPVAEELADAARVETLAHFRAPDLTATSKRADFDPVTVADRARSAKASATVQK